MGIGISYTSNGITSAFSAQGAEDMLTRLDALSKQSESALTAWRAKRASRDNGGGGYFSGKSAEQSAQEREERKQKEREKGYARFSGMTYKQWKARQAKEDAQRIGNGAGKIADAAKAARDFLKKILGFNGALEEKFGKLVLKGESTARQGGIFGRSVRGVFGFFGLDSFDEPKVGKNIVNAQDTDPDPQGGDRKATDNTPFCEDFVTRVFVGGGEENPDDGGVMPKMLYFAFRNRKMTAGGREFACGEETVLPVCEIGGAHNYPGCFEAYIKGNPQDGYELELLNEYYNVGGKTYHTDASYSFVGIPSGILALKIDATGSEPSATIELYSSVSSMQSEQEDKDYYIIPLYTVESGSITCDWRKGVNAAMGEF